MNFTIGKYLPPLRIWSWLEQAFPWLPEAADDAERRGLPVGYRPGAAKCAE